MAVSVDLEVARRTLDLGWSWTEVGAPPLLPEPVQDAIEATINGGTKTYRYVLPTQLLAKVVEPRVDVHSIQVADDSPGAFDARSISHGVIVPFDQANESVLGGSREPYLSNPVRVPRVSNERASTQRDRAGWARLVTVLDWAEEHPDRAEDLFHAVLLAIRARLETVSVVYPEPSRISAPRCLELVAAYVASQSGGDRYEAVATALFRVIGRRWNTWDRVERAHVNASDASTGQVMDLDCYAGDVLVCGVEAKDRDLTLVELAGKVIPAARTAGLTEVFVLARDQASEDFIAISNRVDQAFASGLNIYIHGLEDIGAHLFPLLGEEGRREFLSVVGEALDEHSNLEDRREWALALQGV